MRLIGVALVAALLLSGCETINDTLVRQKFKDWGASRSMKHQIREGLERRRGSAPAGPQELAPPFMDLG
jgi:uncharacterized protein YceK